MASYAVRSVTEEDISTITTLVLEAMKGDILDQDLFPVSEKYTHAQQLTNRRSWMHNLWSRQLSSPQAYLLVAHPSPQTNEIAGFACWHFAEATLRACVQADQPNVTIDAMGDTVPYGMSEILFHECVEKLERVKREVLDSTRPCYHLAMLATSPQHVRKSIGTMLFEWAVQRADAEGALIYLEATHVGVGLYEKFECRRVAEVSFTGGGKRIIMARDAQSRSP